VLHFHRLLFFVKRFQDLEMLKFWDVRVDGVVEGQFAARDELEAAYGGH
jgi:hypothetical protein